ncbi:MAG TPA: sulfotransferase [Solirubrobacteraceae bacterium]
MSDPLEVASRPIFVVGYGRSGTTWTYDLLTSHPQVAGVYESLLLAPEHLGHLHPRTEWDPESHVGISAKPYGIGQLADRDEAVRAARETLVPWLARAVGPEHRWVVEKTPSHVASLRAIADVFPRARIVHVVRDLRDAMASRQDMRRNWFREPALFGTLVAKPYAWRAAAEWVITMGWVEEAAALLPIHEVRYEELRARPAETLAALFAFCGIPADAGLVARIVAENDFAALADTGPGRFRRKGEVGTWRGELSAATRAMIAVRAGGTLAAKGYLRRPPVAHRVAFGVARRLGVAP